jgi:hypothetical protein
MKTTITQNQIFRNFSRLQRSCGSAVFLLLFLLSASSSWGQSIFTNPITGTNPNTANPYTTNQVVDADMTVSGIGRGSGINSENRNDSYYAKDFTNATTLDGNDYFQWTLTPNTCKRISFTQLALEIYKNGEGPRKLVLRSSLDNYASNISITTTNGTVSSNVASVIGDEATFSLTANLSAAGFQNVNTAITFRLYGYDGEGNNGNNSNRRMGVNNFTFSGTVTARTSAGTLSGIDTVCPNGTTTLSSSVSGGTWSSDDTAVATINSTTGVVTGVAAGTATMTYTVTGTGGCANATATRTVTVNSVPTATSTTICAGGSGSLTATSLCADTTGLTSGPNDAGTGANRTGVGTSAWTNPGNITAVGTPFATVAPGAGGTSNYLLASNYGFSIPDNAIINGIQLTIRRSSTQSAGTGNRDNQVRLVKNNNLEATNKSVGGVYPTGLTNQSYGNATDLWGSTWTAADINNAGFGAALSVNNTRFLGAATATVDFMQITVTYTIPGSFQWYTVSSGGTAIGSGSTFNPVGVANSGLVNTNTAGTTSYWVACSTAAGGCRAKADFTINPSPIVTASPDQSICAGSDATISASGATSYEWSNALGTASSVTVSPSTTTTYTVTGTAANGCTNTASTTVTVNTPIGITAITPTTNPITPTQTTTITATGVVGTGAVVTWYSSPNQSGEIGTGLTSPAVGPGTYYAVVTGTCGSAIELATTVSSLASWTGNVNTLWHVTGNWAEGVIPTAATNVVIGDDKVVEISSADAVANKITINGTGTLTVQSGVTLTVTNSINTTAATQFVLESNANLLQGGTTNQNVGPITVKRNSSSIIRLDYTLWSSPVASQGLYAFSKTTLPNRFYRYDTNTNFYTNSVGFNLVNLQYPSPLVAPNGINGTDTAGVTFETGKGYLIRVPWNHPTAPTVWTGNFMGVPNNGTITYTMSDFGEGKRFNLVGNPYPSPISISQFIQDNEANITSSIYFWRKTNGSSLDTYCEWNDEIFTDNEDAQSFDPDDTIRTGQGFFVEGTGAGTALVFNNGQRVNDTANQFFRTGGTTTLSSQNVFWLNLTGSNAQFSQTAIAYKSYATNGLDRYDAKRISPGTISLTSIVEGNNLAIQSKSDFVNTDVVPLSYVVATSGSYSITLDNKIGIFSNGQIIYLKDKVLNVEFNLAEGSYTFVSEVGTFDNRFEIVYQTNALAVTNPIFNESQVVIYKSRSNEISINTGNFVMSSVKIFDISGRLLFEKKDIDASQALLNIGLATEVLLVQITSNDGVVVTKKVLFPRTSLKLDKKIEVKTQLAEDE